MTWLISFVNVLFWFLDMAIFLRVLFSWVRPSPYNPVVAFIHDITDPILEPISRVIPPVGMFDFTPMVAWVLLEVIRRILVFSLSNLLY